MIIKRLGYLVLRCMATTLTTHTSKGMRALAPSLTKSFWYNTSRQLLQSLEIWSNSCLIQRRAAPMPRVFETVSLRVCRVPKLAKIVMSFSSLSAETASIISYIRGSCCAVAPCDKNNSRQVIAILIVYFLIKIGKRVVIWNYAEKRGL